jgi:hypothetical protein
MAVVVDMPVRLDTVRAVLVGMPLHLQKAQAQVHRAKARQLKVLHLKALALVGGRGPVVAHTVVLKAAILLKIKTASVKVL